MAKYKVWTCKIVIDGDSETPSGFDLPPRRAAEEAIRSYGFPIIANFSGWAGELTETEIETIEEDRDFLS